MINLEIMMHWALYAERLAGVLRRRHFVSSLDLMVFWMRISGVIYGLGPRRTAWKSDCFNWSMFVEKIGKSCSEKRDIRG